MLLNPILSDQCLLVGQWRAIEEPVAEWIGHWIQEDQKVWGSIPNISHVKNCQVNFAFHIASVPPPIMGMWNTDLRLDNGCRLNDHIHYNLFYITSIENCHISFFHYGSHSHDNYLCLTALLYYFFNNSFFLTSKENWHISLFHYGTRFPWQLFVFNCLTLLFL